MAKTSVIITTYNSEEWLEKVLWGYSIQTEKNFEIVIADDGSTEKTKELLKQFDSVFQYPIVHVWQKDDGFRKCRILNKAILKTNSEYIIFTDGDCIPREDFIAQHLLKQEKGYFLSGGYFKLDDKLSNHINKAYILNKSCFRIRWLLKNGLNFNFKLIKLTKISFFAKFMNWITPTKKTFNGHNTSCFKEDLLAVNGFNENMQYGGLDREIGERLFNYGVLSKQIRYSAICLHLNHARHYATTKFWKANNEIRKYNIKHHITYIENGIKKNN